MPPIWIARAVTIAFAIGLISYLIAPSQQLRAETQGPAPVPAAGQEVATFAGGCFWCMEQPFDNLDGVISTTSGYMGGKTPNPTYRQVASGRTGHAEVVQVIFDPKKVTYAKLLEVYWRNVDPYDGDGQFCDRGSPYRPAIFAHTSEQSAAAEASKAELQKSGPIKQPIAVKIEEAGAFTSAEDYHQDFYKKNPVRYLIYRGGCGRDARLEALWGKATH